MNLKDIKLFFQKKKYKHLTREKSLLGFFIFFFIIFVFRLFYLQVIQAKYYGEKVYKSHFDSNIIEPERGNIYLTNKGGKYEKLTESVYMFDLAIDPSLIWEGKKQDLIEKLAPILYEHLCVLNGSIKVDADECANNLARFNKKQIDIQSQLEGHKFFQQEYNTGINIDKQGALDLIKQTLDQTIIAGYRPRNYIGNFPDEKFLEELKLQDFDGIEIENNDIYLNPNQFQKSQIDKLVKFFKLKKLEIYDKEFWDGKSNKKPIRYIKIASYINPDIANKIQKIKDENHLLWYRARSRTYVFTGENSITDQERKEIASHNEGSQYQSITLTRYPYRVYPYGSFLSHVLGYVDKSGNPIYGIEQYYDTYLKGKQGKSSGLTDRYIGTIASNDVEIQQAQNGKDIYLSVDPALQRFVEQIIAKSYYEYKADSISVVVMESQTGKIKAQANYPTFDPNNPQKEFEIMPISGEWQKIIDDDTYTEVPFLYQTGNSLKFSNNFDIRKDPSIEKYMFKNIQGSNVFVDKNIRYSYEPGSVFKAFTVAIGMDSDSIYGGETYFNPGFVQVGPHKIHDVDKVCKGTNTFLQALQNSCNTGMSKIFIEVGKQVFYNYVEKFGFGKISGVELAMEEAGNIYSQDDNSLVRMLNNSFGQGLRTTPVQLASAYGALVNGGVLYKPSIVEKICDPDSLNKNSTQSNVDEKNCEIISPKAVSRVISKETSQLMKEALVSVVTQGHSKDLLFEGYELGGKTGTAQISFREKGYMKGNGWSNATFIGFLTKQNPRYVVVVKVARPRNNVYADANAQPIFLKIAKYILGNEGFEK